EAGAYWLHRARLYRRQLDEKVFGTQAEIARHEGVSRARMSQITMLLRLDERLQQDVLAGSYGIIADRTLREIVRLRKAKRPMTAPACFEQLASGHLNMVLTGPDDQPAYIATEPDAEQRDLLERLRLSYLVDEAEIASRIQPRPAA
ncbi:MAG: hypothetical protein J7M25_17145, partial [Deltaproteobacteria bacterium]|nr:hypothetical protein [Deltaproteobacteria bacterium]